MRHTRSRHAHAPPTHPSRPARGTEPVRGSLTDRRRARGGRRPRTGLRRPGRGGALQGPGVLQDHRLPARLHPGRYRRDPAARPAEQLHRRRHRGRHAVHRRQPGTVRGRGLPVGDRRPGHHPVGEGRLPALHRERRRLRGHPRRLRQRLQLVLVRQPGRRVLQAAPRHPAGHRRRRGPHPPVHGGPAELVHPHRRVVRLPDQPALRGACPGLGGRQLLQRLDDGRRPPHHLVPRLRRRACLVHRHGPHHRELHRAELPAPAARRHPDRGRRRGRRLLGRLHAAAGGARHPPQGARQRQVRDRARHHAAADRRQHDGGHQRDLRRGGPGRRQHRAARPCQQPVRDRRERRRPAADRQPGCGGRLGDLPADPQLRRQHQPQGRGQRQVRDRGERRRGGADRQPHGHRAVGGVRPLHELRPRHQGSTAAPAIRSRDDLSCP
ncbi:hypothetical protein SBRY_40646 [Actinacidiphila bryophytorum]|uniref:Uncharacterized protein n=1 Tax=Actinacidiphila bryophytorum TaxID=1436133 RepID=A0A9W4H3D2_9ACTN|nr:hypothetical protein SBRY_40646 [Actinacidiphila bryophytorum]